MKEIILMKWLATGDILELWQSDDHPDAKPGHPVWTDKDATNWGDRSKWPVPYGFIRLDDPDIRLFSLGLNDYWNFKLYLTSFYKIPITSWPKGSKMLRYPGMPSYRLKYFTSLEDGERLVVIFDEPILLYTGEKSDRFVINYRPALELKMNGDDSVYIPFF